jgi:hypothetical protein
LNFIFRIFNKHVVSFTLAENFKIFHKRLVVAGIVDCDAKHLFTARKESNAEIPQRRIELDKKWHENNEALTTWKHWSFKLTGLPGAPKGLRLDDWKAVVGDDRDLDMARF